MSISFPKDSLDLLVRNEEIKAHFGDDAFFSTCHLIPSDIKNITEVVIDDTCPVLVNNALKDKINVPENMISLREGRTERLRSKGFMALAAGGFVWLGDHHMALLMRDSKAPLLPEHWTNPSGMCGEHPFDTADKETVEELALFDPTKNQIIRFQQAGTEPPQNNHVVGNLKRRGFLNGASADFRHLTLGGADCERLEGEHSVIVVVGSNQRLRVLPHIHHDIANNQLVLNQAFRVSADHRSLLVVDGEKFGRNGDILTAEGALKLQLVPTTRDYLEHAIPR